MQTAAKNDSRMTEKRDDADIRFSMQLSGNGALHQALGCEVTNRAFCGVKSASALGLCRCRKWRIELVFRLHLLPLPSVQHLAPSTGKCAWLGHVIFYLQVQIPKVVAGNTGVHMVLGVPVHMPVQKLDKLRQLH